MNYNQLSQIIPGYSEKASIRLPAKLVKRMFEIVEAAKEMDHVGDCEPCAGEVLSPDRDPDNCFRCYVDQTLFDVQVTDV